METTAAKQDYLKVVYLLADSGAQVTTSAIADRLRVKPATVTAMIKRLAEEGLIKHRPYHGVKLTAQGRGLALEIIRHHRLLETYLHQALGLSWDRIHDEAEVLEHALSENLEDRIAEVLGHPTVDPHGDPIPPKEGSHVEVRHGSLDACNPGSARVERVSDRDPQALRYLEKIGLTPGTKVVVEERSPFGGPIWIRLGKKRHALGRELARLIQVSANPT